MISIWGNDNNPAFRWEGLVCSIYNCGKYGDPHGYAAQDFFTNFVPEPNQRGKVALAHIVLKLVERFPDNEKLANISKQAKNVETQIEVIDIIDKLIGMADELGLK